MISKLNSEKLIKQTFADTIRCKADKTKANIKKIRPSSPINLISTF